MKKSRKLALHATWWIQTSVLVLWRHSTYREEMSRYLKRFITLSRFLPLSQILGRMYNTDVSIKCMMWKACRRSPSLLENNYCLQIVQTGFAEQFQALTGWGLHQFVWKFPREQLKARPIGCHSFLIGQYILSNMVSNTPEWDAPFQSAGVAGYTVM